MEQILSVADWRHFAATANSAFLLAFPSLFSIINPIGGALIFYGFTKNFSSDDRLKVAASVGFYSLLVMFGALWAGAYVLSFFGVSLDALRIAGGTVIALSGFQLLTSSEPHPDQKSHERAKIDASASDPMQLAFFPLTLPFTTGPGTIAVAITVGAERPQGGADFLPFFVGASVAALANAAIIWIGYRFADRLTGLIGPTARQVIVRLTAFLLMCIGVQILVTAVGDLATKWRVA
ncbi:MAG TPA: MarC family protein [Roseiarcus sp.]|jgi:multiple antibiotic resistance protein